MKVQSKAGKILKQLNYDFRTFTIDAFIARIEEYKQREIVRIPMSMPGGTFGAWVSDAAQPLEYIFYRSDVPPIHQIHIQLHELAHLLLGHQTLSVTPQMLADWLQGKNLRPLEEQARLRSTVTDDQELEAETLASMIQHEVIRASRLDELTRVVSSDQKVAEYLQGLGLSE